MRVTGQLGVLAAVVMATGCAMGLAGFSGVRGSGDIVTVEPVVENFSRVRTGHSCRLSVVPSNDYSVVVRIDDNVRDDLDVDVEGSTLRIQLQPMRNYRNVHCVSALT